MSEIEAKPECHVNIKAEPNFIDKSLNKLDQENPILIEALKKMMVKPTPVNYQSFVTWSRGLVVKADAHDQEVMSSNPGNGY